MAVSTQDIELFNRLQAASDRSHAKVDIRQSMSQLLGAQYDEQGVERHMSRLMLCPQPDDCPLTARFYSAPRDSTSVDAPSSRTTTTHPASRAAITVPERRKHATKGHKSFKRRLWNSFKCSDPVLRLREFVVQRGYAWNNISYIPVWEADLARMVIRNCIIQEAPQHEGLCQDDIEIIRIYPSGCLALTWLHCKGGLREDAIGLSLPYAAPTFRVGNSGSRQGTMSWYIARFYWGGTS